MTPFPDPQPFVKPDGRPSVAAHQWIAKLIAELKARDETIAALEARIAALEAA